MGKVVAVGVDVGEGEDVGVGEDVGEELIIEEGLGVLVRVLVEDREGFEVTEEEGDRETVDDRDVVEVEDGEGEVQKEAPVEEVVPKGQTLHVVAP